MDSSFGLSLSTQTHLIIHQSHCERPLSNSWFDNIYHKLWSASSSYNGVFTPCWLGEAEVFGSSTGTDRCGTTQAAAKDWWNRLFSRSTSSGARPRRNLSAGRSGGVALISGDEAPRPQRPLTPFPGSARNAIIPPATRRSRYRHAYQMTVIVPVTSPADPLATLKEVASLTSICTVWSWSR